MRTRRTYSSSNPVAAEPAKRATSHQPVLLHEAVLALDIRQRDTLVDATLGGAGHAKALAEKLGRGGLFIGFDLDSDAISRAEAALTNALCRVELIQSNFRDLKSELQERNVDTIDKALFDLGWSSDQLASGRGFSFLKDEPLLMTYVKEPDEATLTAAIIVNEWEEESIADILYGWGEERYARRIARAIVERRAQKTIGTSAELAELIKYSVPPAYAYGRIHPATRSFQALRIAVNDELGAIEEGLKSAWDMLAPNGRIAVITFHSIEDRIVKRMFADFEKNGLAKRINKKPIVPSERERVNNLRARSAKLRVVQKNNLYDKTSQKDKPVHPFGSAGDFAI